MVSFFSLSWGWQRGLCRQSHRGSRSVRGVLSSTIPICNFAFRPSLERSHRQQFGQNKGKGWRSGCRQQLSKARGKARSAVSSAGTGRYPSLSADCLFFPLELSNTCPPPRIFPLHHLDAGSNLRILARAAAIQDAWHYHLFGTPGIEVAFRRCLCLGRMGFDRSCCGPLSLDCDSHNGRADSN